MARNKNKSIKQILNIPKSDQVLVKSSEDRAEGNTPIDKSAKQGRRESKSKRSNKKGSHNHQNSNKTDQMTIKVAETVAKKGTFVVISKHTNLAMAILLSTLLTRTMTAVDTIMQSKKVPEYIRKRLVEQELDVATGLPLVPRKALVKPLETPVLPLDKTTTVLIKTSDLDENDKIELTANLRAKHDDSEASRLLSHQAAEATRRAAHDSAEMERKRQYSQRVGEEFEAYLEANPTSRNMRSASPTPLSPAPYVPGAAFVPVAPVASPLVPPAVTSSSFEYVETEPGKYVKVHKPHVKEVRVPLGQALAGLEVRVYSSIEADEVLKKYHKSMSEYHKSVKSQETDESNYLSTLWSCLSESSKSAVAEKLPGGKVALESLCTEKKRAAVLDLVYRTHGSESLYKNCSAQDKQAFIAAEHSYLSKDKVQQRQGESVVKLVEGLKRYYDLSLQLASLCGPDWKHEETTWIQNVASYSSAPSLVGYKSALLSTDPPRGALGTQYMSTFTSQCEELVKVSQEASIGKLLAQPQKRRTKKDNKSRSRASVRAPDASTATVVKTSLDDSSAPTGPVKHFTDASKVSSSVLQATVRTRRDEVEKLISSGKAGAVKTPKRPRESRGPRTTSARKNSKLAHSKSKHPKSDKKSSKKARHVHHTDVGSPGYNSRSDASSSDDDENSDSGDDEGSDEYSAHLTIPSLRPLKCCQEVAPGCCKGSCCLTTRPRKESFTFAKAPKGSFSASRLGVLAVDTASSVNVCSTEHAGDEPVLPLRRPTRLRGVQGMRSVVTHYSIHQVLGLCLLGDSAGILGYGMLTSMGYRVVRADKSVTSIKHPKLKGVAPVNFHRTADKLFVASDPTTTKGWQGPVGKDRVGHFRSTVNSQKESEQQYKVSYDEGDMYVDRGVRAVQVEAFDADDVLDHVVSDLAQPTLSTEVEGRLGGAKGCSPQSN